VTNDDYMIAYRIGDDFAREAWGRLAELSPDKDYAPDFDERVFPEAFADALDALPNEDALDISDAVHAGIAHYWRCARLSKYSA
jgi:hypothetical protein